MIDLKRKELIEEKLLDEILDILNTETIDKNDSDENRKPGSADSNKGTDKKDDTSSNAGDGDSKSNGSEDDDDQKTSNGSSNNNNGASDGSSNNNESSVPDQPSTNVMSH